MKKILVFFIMLFIVLLSLYYFFPEVTLFTTLENIKASHEEWVVLYQQHPSRVITIFFIFNTFMALLPIPGISMISLLGGSIFGFFPGVIYSSIATLLGNLGSFFIARYFLQDYVCSKYGNELRLFRSSFQIEGTMALFSFRLFPFVPSFVANLVMGVSPLHWWNFFWASWVGRIPMVLVYTWSGVQISKVRSLEDILSPGIVIAFILLAILPWPFRLVIKKFKA
jgi:uncharacterized membrane protein YdjX (TVP38/TMEM64 family)